MRLYGPTHGGNTGPKMARPGPPSAVLNWNHPSPFHLGLKTWVAMRLIRTDGRPPAHLATNSSDNSNKQTPPSPPHHLQLQPPHRRKRHARKRNRDPRPDIAAVPSDVLRHGPRVPRLVHADDGAGPPDQKGEQRRDAERQALLVLPRRPVEGDAAERAEQDVLLDHDGDEDGDPVAHEGEEVFEDVEEVVAAGDAADELDDDDGDDPEPARDGFEVAAEDLHVDCGGVGAGDVVLDGRQGEDDGAEAAEPSQAAVAGEQECARGRGVGGLPGRGDGDPAA